jgi:hypothetical protein
MVKMNLSRIVLRLHPSISTDGLRKILVGATTESADFNRELLEYNTNFTIWYTQSSSIFKKKVINLSDRFCGLVVRVPGYWSRGPGLDSRRYQIFWEIVGLERVQLSLVRIIEELLEWKSSGSGSRNPRLTAVEIRCAYHVTRSIRKSWH